MYKILDVVASLLFSLWIRTNICYVASRTPRCSIDLPTDAPVQHSEATDGRAKNLPVLSKIT